MAKLDQIPYKNESIFVEDGIFYTGLLGIATKNNIAHEH